MAKVKNNILLRGLSGSIGNMVFRQMPDGSTQVSLKPDYDRRKFNREQKSYQDRFSVAVAYAREAKGDPAYAGLARQAGKSAYHLALADGLKAPVIHRIERSDGRVCVTASDNVMVTNVQVRILDRNGKPLEQGYAALPDPIHEPERWEYACGTEGRVEASAWDLAGNETRAVFEG